MSSKWTTTLPERQSKWTVRALGEKQLDGGVGGSLNDQAFDDRVQQANPSGPDFADNASNSYEQEVALKTWVDMAVDMLNRGAGNEDVLAKLSHDGCPDPETVVEMALQQPEQDFTDDQAGEDAFSDLPPVANEPQQSAPAPAAGADLPRSAKVWENLWGQEVVMPERSVKISADPVSEIQAFIDSFEPIEETKPETVLARLENLKTARRALRGIGQRAKLSWVQAQQLTALDDDTQAELLHLSAAVGDLAFQTADEYLASQPKFRVNAFDIEGDPNVVEEDIRQESYDPNRMDEDAEILAAEHAEQGLEATRWAALRFIEGKVDAKTGAAVCEHFAQRVEHYAAKYASIPEVTEKTASTEDVEGPAEQLFL